MNILITGGDSRIVELAKKIVNDGFNVELYGLENCDELKSLNHVASLKEGINNSDLIITSIPISKNGKVVNAPYSNQTIEIKDVFELSKGKKIITGNITDEIKSFINLENKNEIIDIIKFEELAILNSIPTAEGAIQIAMEKSNITLHGSNCLVMGFGRIGKILAKMLSGIGANVYCEARKSTDIAYIKSYNYNAIDLKDLEVVLSKFDFIFNTIPYVILNEDYLKKVKKDCLIIDLASKPGGVDFEKAKELGIKTQWALALPRKGCT